MKSLSDSKFLLYLEFYLEQTCIGPNLATPTHHTLPDQNGLVCSDTECDVTTEWWCNLGRDKHEIHTLEGQNGQFVSHENEYYSAWESSVSYFKN